MESTPGMSTIRQITIAVTDIDSSAAFLRDVLGLEYLFSLGENLTFFAASDIRIMLTTGESAAKPGAKSILYISMNEIEIAYSTLVN